MNSSNGKFISLMREVILTVEISIMTGLAANVESQALYLF